MSYKKPRVKREKKFEDVLIKNAGYFKCKIVKVPDPVIPKDWVKPTAFREKRRPCDLIMIAPNGVFLIEAKTKNVPQSEHQKQKDLIYNSINPKSYFVLRRWESKKRNTPLYETVYDIKQKGELVARLFDLVEVFRWFIAL